jgi:hypothetical protein
MHGLAVGRESMMQLRCHGFDYTSTLSPHHLQRLG